MVIVGTRPEVIKMAPVVHAIRRRPDELTCTLCVVSQQLDILEGALAEWELVPDRRVGVTAHGKGLSAMLAGIVQPVEEEIRKAQPDIVLVHGDTTTALAGAVAALYAEVPVGHVEAGLRTHDLKNPFPEEANRQLIDRIASLHLAPTDHSLRNLLQEGVPRESIAVVGNTGVDALMGIKGQLGLPARRNGSNRKTILVTGHRRENRNGGLDRVCEALRKLVLTRSDVEIAYVTHPNPLAQGAPKSWLSDVPNVKLVSPLSYREFVTLMSKAYLLLTDSGGVQEEAPYMRKPVLVTREITERPEGIDLGVARLVGTDQEEILDTITSVLDDPAVYAHMTRATQPYGDGHAAERICDEILETSGRVHMDQDERRLAAWLETSPVFPIPFLTAAIH